MASRTITRVALLQDYTGASELLLPVIDEVAAKGYDAVAFFIKMEELDVFGGLCEKAASLDLGVSVFTGYMKYQYEYLSRHPQQRMVSVSGGVDQDGISNHSWGCPFNPDFKQRYFDFLRAIAAMPGVFRIAVNDEAYLGDGCYCAHCQRAWEEEVGGEMPRIESPCEDDWDNESWRAYLHWKMNRWDLVHGEMAEIVRQVNPATQVIFQASPAVDLWRNPWITGVNLAGMVEHLDGLSTDPYYTFHDVPHFQPREVYLSEWSRFLAGIVPAGKVAEMVPQAFSHPSFTRPLGAQDGYWAALVPPACGIDTVTPYTYTLQRCSPMQKTYEDCFRLDGYFERTAPLQYAGLVHGAQTEIYRRPMPAQTPGSYDGTRVLPVADALRHRGLPYAYIPDSRLHDAEALRSFPVLILPEVNCLSTAQAQGIGHYAEAAGNLVILGQLGVCDEVGSPHDASLLQQTADIEVIAETDEQRHFTLVPTHPLADALQTLLDEDIPERLRTDCYAPTGALTHCVDAEVPADAEVIAEFVTADGTATGRPAIVSLDRGSRVVWFAGFPARTTVTPVGINVRNHAHLLLPALAEWAAGDKPPLRVENWPPSVPMKDLRPLDHRYMPTCEFFPLAGDDLFVGLVTSYFGEPTAFPIVLDIPPGKQLQSIEEAISGAQVSFEIRDGQATVEVALDFDTPALLYVFALA